MERGNELRVALVGQPNCGKSTLFTAVSGYYVETGNFSGTTVKFTEARVNYKGSKIKLLDLPGIYSINSYDEAEKVTREKILSGDIDIIINVIDATVLARSLELTIQLIEMNVPMVVVLNMMDEAEKKGLQIDIDKFYELTGVRAFPVVAVKGTGISDLFNNILEFDYKNYLPKMPVYDRDVEECISDIARHYPENLLNKYSSINERFFIIRLLEMDEYFEELAGSEDIEFLQYVKKKRSELAELHNWPEKSVFASHRHAYVLDIFEKVSSVRSRKKRVIIEDIDRFLINPIGGFISLSIVFGSIFLITFYLGDTISSFLEGPLEKMGRFIIPDSEGYVKIILAGLWDGINGGLGIVIPYFIPLILLLSVLEDSGVLPRLAFMLDGIIHRFGLHGKAIIPFLIGYGCNVPAIMSSRTLENQWDRKIVILLSSFIPCSARTVVILALVTKYLGWFYTLLLYFLNIVVILLLSSLISRYKKVESEGFIMDVPPLRRPYIGTLIKKVWYRSGEFIFFAWPIIVFSSILLGLFGYWQINSFVNRILNPLTSYILNLPEELGIPLFFGIFRKELSLVMLYQVLGTENIDTVLSSGQIWVLVVFITFYIPCIATISTTYKEGGLKLSLFSVMLNFVVAILIAGFFALIIS